MVFSLSWSPKNPSSSYTRWAPAAWLGQDLSPRRWAFLRAEPRSHGNGSQLGGLGGGKETAGVGGMKRSLEGHESCKLFNHFSFFFSSRKWLERTCSGGCFWQFWPLQWSAQRGKCSPLNLANLAWAFASAGWHGEMSTRRVAWRVWKTWPSLQLY